MPNEMTFEFFDEKGKLLPIEVEQAKPLEPGGPEEQHSAFEPHESYVHEKAGYSTQFTICTVKGVPDLKTDIVYRTIKLPFGKKIRVPTVRVQKRSCDTRFVARFSLATEAIGPILLTCSVAAAAAAAPVIIAGCATGVAAAPAVAAGLEVFTNAVAACAALKGIERKVFDVALDQVRTCSAWESVA